MSGHRSSKAVLYLGLAACVLTLDSCALLKFGRKGESKRGFPRRIAVLPTANLTNDVGAGVILRYFLERGLAGKGFVLTADSNDVDRRLRQIGITDGTQLSQGNIQYAGQTLEADGVVQSTLRRFSQQPGESRKALQADFTFILTQTGRILWSETVEVEGKGEVKIPIRGSASMEWSEKFVRSIARGQAGALPRKAVKEALGSLRP
ncbi:MAG: hypothetical protein A2902_03190 [Elusimicrobia bacterium RIFCSPLOWO2_01_FULL_64_13]|nr:MAG: hypothetical protein A2636_04485 [Elusimicrobia bacterium RIFCSPHIGHO2_01_FULL_64_10]OGR96228.1 MAG: hypothetical protein A2902_03190 [Elusimicrobia bacterium RIFCSPLOWO2_01_FULL_64_13]